MHPAPDQNDTALWLFSLYGATMLGVQSLEYAVSFLYAIVNTSPTQPSNASSKRQLKGAVDRMWHAFQEGSAGMKLNDRKVGIKDHVAPELYAELDAFLKGPRNQLAHNFLLERIALVDQDGTAALLRAAGELIPISQKANRLREQLQKRSLEIIASWPDSPGPPEEMEEWLERMTRMTTLKQFPADVIDKARGTGETEETS